MEPKHLVSIASHWPEKPVVVSKKLRSRPRSSDFSSTDKYVFFFENKGFLKDFIKKTVLSNISV